MTGGVVERPSVSVTDPRSATMGDRHTASSANTVALVALPVAAGPTACVTLPGQRFLSNRSKSSCRTSAVVRSEAAVTSVDR